jgi:hypothetical protein
MCASFVSFGDFGFYVDHFSVEYQTACPAIVFGTSIMKGCGSWGMGRLSFSGYLVCFFLFVGWKNSC